MYYVVELASSQSVIGLFRRRNSCSLWLERTIAHISARHLTHYGVFRSLVHNAASGGNAQLLSYLLDSGGASSVTRGDDEVTSPSGPTLGPHSASCVMFDKQACLPFKTGVMGQRGKEQPASQ